MLIKFSNFDGLRPALDPRLLPPNAATEATNTKLVNGTLRSWQSPKFVLTLPKIGTIQSIYRFGQNTWDENLWWFHWTQDVDVVRGPVADTGTERTYWTGEAYPMYSYTPIAITGGVYPAAAYRLGIPRPETSPVAVAGALPPMDAVDSSQQVKVASITAYDQTTAEVTLTAPTTFDRTVATKVIVANATPAQFNGSYDVTWVDASTFRYHPSKATVDGGKTPNSEILEITNIQRIDANTAQVALASVSDFVRTDSTTVSVVGCTVSQFNGTFPATWVSEQVLQYHPTQSSSVTYVNTKGGALGAGVYWALERIGTFQAQITLRDSTRFDQSATARVYIQNVVTPSILNGTFDATWVDDKTLTFTTTVEIPAGIVIGPDNPPGITLTITAPSLVDLPTSPAPSGVAVVTLSGNVSTELPTGSSVTGVDSVYLSGKATPEDNRAREDRTYVVTFVSPLGEEGPPCKPTNILEIVDKQGVTLNSIPLPPAGPWNLPSTATKRIYRSATSGSSAVFLFVAEIPVTQTDYTDVAESNALGEALPSDNWIPPPVDLVGLCMLANGVACGFRAGTNEVWFSEPNLPHAWPNMVALDYRVVGLGAFGTSVAVGTVGTPYIITGIDPAQMTASKIPVEQSCASKRSICAVAGGVIYASPDGLCLADGTGIKVLTKDLLLPEQWRAYNPSSMMCRSHQGRVFCNYTQTDGTKGALVLDMAGGAVLWTTDIKADAMYTDLATDAMYYVDAGTRNLMKWDFGDTPLTYEWSSGVREQPFPTNFGFLQVLADTPWATVIVLAGDDPNMLEVRFVASVTGDTPMRLPGGFRARYWTVLLNGTGTVYAVLLANTAGELSRA